jgi:hypothetical protein
VLEDFGSFEYTNRKRELFPYVPLKATWVCLRISQKLALFGASKVLSNIVLPKNPREYENNGVWLTPPNLGKSAEPAMLLKGQ